jgi:hypothetical protein
MPVVLFLRLMLHWLTKYNIRTIANWLSGIFRQVKEITKTKLFFPQTFFSELKIHIRHIVKVKTLFVLYLFMNSIMFELFPFRLTKLLKAKPGDVYMDLVVSFESIDDEDVGGPPVRYFFGLWYSIIILYVLFIMHLYIHS